MCLAPLCPCVGRLPLITGTAVWCVYVLLCQERLDDVAFSESMQRAATSGGNIIKLVDVKGWKEVRVGVCCTGLWTTQRCLLLRWRPCVVCPCVLGAAAAAVFMRHTCQLPLCAPSVYSPRLVPMIPPLATALPSPVSSLNPSLTRTLICISLDSPFPTPPPLHPSTPLSNTHAFCPVTSPTRSDQGGHDVCGCHVRLHHGAGLD